MTDGRPGRSSRYVDEERAALDLKKPGHSTFPTGADGSSPRVASLSRCNFVRPRFPLKVSLCGDHLFAAGRLVSIVL